MKEDHRDFRRGEIYYADLGYFRGSEQGGIRPVLIIQNDKGNFHCPTLTVAPLTSKYKKKRNQPTHCELHSVDGLPQRSSINGPQEQKTTRDRDRGLHTSGNWPLPHCCLPPSLIG